MSVAEHVHEHDRPSECSQVQLGQEGAVEEQLRMGFRVVDRDAIEQRNEQKVELVILLSTVVVKEEVSTSFIEDQVRETILLFLDTSAEVCPERE
jgi:hypothetical protein